MLITLGRGRAGALFRAVTMPRPAALVGRARIRGIWHAECRDWMGRLKWVEDFKNIVVDEALDELLDVTLSGATPDTTWFVGLKDTGTPAAGDTLASHVSWAELDVHTGDRQAWVDGGVSGQSVDNSGSPADFAITVADTVYGAFLCGVTTGTAATLYAAGDFAAPRVVEISDTLSVTATFTMADDGV